MDCLFCELLKSGKILKTAESENFVAFLDINPRTKGQTLVISKKHYENFEKLPENILKELGIVVQKIIDKIKVVLKAKGFSIVTNSGELAGQRIPHFALIIYPRYESEETKGIPLGAFFKPIETSEQELVNLSEKLKVSVKIKQIEEKIPEKEKGIKENKQGVSLETKKTEKKKPKKTIPLKKRDFVEFV